MSACGRIHATAVSMTRPRYHAHVLTAREGCEDQDVESVVDLLQEVRPQAWEPKPRARRSRRGSSTVLSCRASGMKEENADTGADDCGGSESDDRAAQPEDERQARTDHEQRRRVRELECRVPLVAFASEEDRVRELVRHRRRQAGQCDDGEACANGMEDGVLQEEEARRRRGSRSTRGRAPAAIARAERAADRPAAAAHLVSDPRVKPEETTIEVSPTRSAGARSGRFPTDRSSVPARC